MLHKRKRVTRLRGSRNHGWGRMHRNSGQRGGAGNAGSGKRADAKKPSYADRAFGKHGFKQKGPTSASECITLRDIEDRATHWVASKQAKTEQGKTAINLTALGYTKLLATGKLTKPFLLTISSAAPAAVEKVKAAGGDVALA
ncbi:uL15 family ribosomal protein [Candidatus Woesearchaeota archaeon]|nr:uL15 family ribosomal protein [Candidatus Woesearchaeota archaeon]